MPNYSSNRNYRNYRQMGAGGLVNKGVEKGFGLFGLEDTAAENMVSGAAGAVAGYFTGDYGAIAQGAGDFTQGTGQIVDDVAGRDTKYGEVAGALQSGGHAVGSFMGGNIGQGIQQGNQALGQAGDLTGIGGNNGSFYANGGTLPPPGNRPTYADSAAVLQSSLNLQDHFANEGYQPLTSKTRGGGNYMADLDLASANVQRDFANRVPKNITRPGKKMGSIYLPEAVGQGEEAFLDPAEYRQNLNRNQFTQRDLANSIINMSNPTALYDRRIAPQSYNEYKRGKDVVGSYTYDPLAVTPWRDLNPSQREERIKKYGVAGTPGDTSTFNDPPRSKPKSPRLKDVMEERTGLDFTDENRAKIAKDAGIENYTKTSAQNKQIMDYLNNLGKVTVTGGPSAQQMSTPPDNFVPQPIQIPQEQGAVPTPQQSPETQHLLRGYNPGGYFAPGDTRYADPLKSVTNQVNAKHRGGTRSIAPTRSFAQGGYPGAMYEAEGGEVIEGGNPQVAHGGYVSPNSSNAGMIEGNSHSNGGVQMSGGERIYSDQIYLDQDFIDSLEL